VKRAKLNPFEIMKSLVLLSVLISLPLAAAAQKAEKPAPAPKQVPPPVSIVTPPAAQAQTYVYEQKPMGGRPLLVTPEQAQSLIDKFKSNLGTPRLVIFVNRELVDEKSGLKLLARTEKTEGTRDNEQVKAENRYRLQERKDASLADKQTVRDVERLFGRPLRAAGASLADQRIAAQFLGSKPFQTLAMEGDQARRDREALSKIADVAVEVLISSKQVQVTELAGDRTYNIPDIQATAVRLSDARIMGQASSSDVIGRVGGYGRNYDVREVSEATALALMEDMLMGVEVAAKAEK
jgi:hypothetical protein